MFNFGVMSFDDSNINFKNKKFSDLISEYQEDEQRFYFNYEYCIDIIRHKLLDNLLGDKMDCGDIDSAIFDVIFSLGDDSMDLFINGVDFDEINQEFNPDNYRRNDEEDYILIRDTILSLLSDPTRMCHLFGTVSFLKNAQKEATFT